VAPINNADQHSTIQDSAITRPAHCGIAGRSASAAKASATYEYRRVRVVEPAASFRDG